MVIDPEVLNAIKIIDRKIVALTEARKRLEEAFGTVPNQQIDGLALESLGSCVVRLTKANEKGRKLELARYLAENGPMNRAEIVNNLGFPEGTISYCLKDKSIFRRLHDGRWDVEPTRSQEIEA